MISDIKTEFICPACGAASKPSRCLLNKYQIYVCPLCAMVFTPTACNVMLDYDDVYDTQEYIASQVAAIERMRDPSEYASIPTYRVFFENVHSCKGKKLLDVGCGVGRFCHLAHAHGWDVTGIDVSAKAIEFGKRRASFPMYSRTIEECAQYADKYDVITAFEVLEHLSKPIELLAKCRSI